MNTSDWSRMGRGDELTQDEALEDLYTWVDTVSFTKPKKNFSRDFADGVMVAELVKHFCPRIVELHNYPEVHSVQHKTENWTFLNRKVFKKLGCEFGEDVIYKVVNCEPYAVEQVLMVLRRKIEMYLYERKRQKERTDLRSITSDAKPGASAGCQTQDAQLLDKPEADQNTHGATQESEQLPEMVPKIMVEEKQQEVLAKEETIQILQAKIKRLEHLVHLKDVRIDDLSDAIKETGEDIRRNRLPAPKKS